MEIEQCSTESSLGQGKIKEIKDFLEFNENENKTYPKLWYTMKTVLREKVHSTKCLHKEHREISH